MVKRDITFMISQLVRVLFPGMFCFMSIVSLFLPLTGKHLRFLPLIRPHMIIHTNSSSHPCSNDNSIPPAHVSIEPYPITAQSPNETSPKTPNVAEQSLASPHASPNPPSWLTRQTKAPSYLCDITLVSLSLQGQPKSSNSAMFPATGITYPLSNVLSYHILSPQHYTFTISLSATKNPMSFEQASRDPKWFLAMQHELAALKANGTWYLHPLPPVKKPIGCKWVYKTKFKPDGTIEHYKSLLVAKRYNQI